MAWAVPVVAVATPAPAASASPLSTPLTIKYNTTGPCGSTDGGTDMYMYVNLTNTSGSSYTLTAPLVLEAKNANTSRSHVAPSSTIGTQSCNGGGSLTTCNDVLWTIPAGTTIAAGAIVDMGWHFLWMPGQPTSFTVTEAGTSLVTNSGVSTASGYTNNSNGPCSGNF